MRNIMVTGGAGFLGSHLCDRLIENNDRVICVDNFFTGQPENIRHLLDHPRFALIEHDIIEALFVTEKVDQIYNLACPASPIHYQLNPVRTVKANTVGMINILGLAKKTGARILQASTSEVYGDPEVSPQTETYNGNVNCVGPRACYDEGKRVAETLCMDYNRSNKVEVRLARIFNTHGPRMHPQDGRVVSTFITQALQNKPIPIYGNGRQTRSFCYVDDMIEALVKLMNQDNHTGPINLGNPQEITIKELAEYIIENTGSKSTVEYRPLPQDDPKQRRPDIALAKNILDWEPKTSLVAGLQKTIEYFKSRY